MSTMEEQEELIGEDLYGTLWAEGVTSDSFARLAERIAAVRAEGADGIMSCPLYSHGWANDDDRRGEVHCCDRKGHEMSWNPDEMRDEVKLAGIDPASVLAPKEKP